MSFLDFDYRYFLLSLPWILLALAFHEFCHAWISYRLGDPTPEWDKRLTLNPLRHVDPIGILAFALFRFGWAKPVQINPRYYKNPMKDTLLVALAGPAGNFILAILFGIIIRIIDPLRIALFDISISGFLMIGVVYNLGLGVFNLIPIPPLDGSKIIRYFLKGSAGYQYDRIEPYGFFILIFFLIFNLHQFILTPVVAILTRLLTGQVIF